MDDQDYIDVMVRKAEAATSHYARDRDIQARVWLRLRMRNLTDQALARYDQRAAKRAKQKDPTNA